jgi:hypothetical protein
MKTHQFPSLKPKLVKIKMVVEIRGHWFMCPQERDLTPNAVSVSVHEDKVEI